MKAESNTTIKLNPEIIITKINFGDTAKKKIQEYFDENKNKKERITTTKIRNILDLVNKLYNRVQRTTDRYLSEDILADLAYIKIKIAYDSGKENTVKKFIEKTEFVEALNAVLEQKTRDHFILFSRYIESLIAYFKFYGGKDK